MGARQTQFARKWKQLFPGVLGFLYAAAVDVVRALKVHRPSLKRVGGLLRTSHYGHHQGPALRSISVFAKVNSLPGLERKGSIRNRNRQAAA